MRNEYEFKISKNHTMPIDGFKENGTNSNLLVIGSSGTGKTMSVVLPMLLDSFKDNPITFVVQDCKGLLYKNLSKKFLDEGYDVKVLDFVNPRKSNIFNPFDYIVDMDDAKRIIDSLASDKVHSSKDQYWETAAKELLCNLVMYIKRELSPDLFNLSFLSRVLSDFSKEVCIVLDAKDRNVFIEGKIDRNYKVLEVNKDKSKYATIFYNRLLRYNAKRQVQFLKDLENYYYYPYNTFESIVAVAKGILSAYASDDMRKLMSGLDQMNLYELANSKTIIFVNPSDVNRIYDSAIALFYSMCLQYAVRAADCSKDGRLKYPFRFIIDDFASGAKINDFDKAISNIRSRNISCTLLIQSTSQLETLYSNTEAKTLISNCSSQLYLGSNDFDQEQNISKRLNMSYNDLHELDRRKIVIISENRRPIIDLKYNFKEHPNYQLCGLYDEKNYFEFYQIKNYKEGNRMQHDNDL